MPSKDQSLRCPWWRHQMETFSVVLAICAGNSPALMFSLKSTRINDWVNNGEAGYMRHHRAHYDVTVMVPHCDRQLPLLSHCPACRTSLIATRFWVVVICPIIKCLTVLEFSFILFDLCLFITIFNFILNYVPIVTFWIFTYHKIWILLIIFCFIWNY